MNKLYTVYCLTTKQAGVLGDALGGAGRGIYNVTGTTLDRLDPRTPPPDNTLAYSLVHGITRYFAPRMFDQEPGGPYNEFSEYLKDTEVGDLLLREAAKLRQRARIILKQKEQAEKEKHRAASSRYF